MIETSQSHGSNFTRMVCRNMCSNFATVATDYFSVGNKTIVHILNVTESSVTFISGSKLTRIDSGQVPWQKVTRNFAERDQDYVKLLRGKRIGPLNIVVEFNSLSLSATCYICLHWLITLTSHGRSRRWNQRYLDSLFNGLMKLTPKRISVVYIINTLRR